jgi:hypothetical protein
MILAKWIPMIVDGQVPLIFERYDLHFLFYYYLLLYYHVLKSSDDVDFDWKHLIE